MERKSKIPNTELLLVNRFPLRIGIDCRMYSSRFTGIGRYVYELTENLFKLDLENDYVLFFNNPEFEEFKPPNKRVQKILVNSPHYSLQEQTLFFYHLQKANLDLMHFTHFNAPVLYSRPSVVTIHDLTLSFFAGKKMTSLLHRLGYQLTLQRAIGRAKKIISVSKNTKKDLQKLFNVTESKIEVIYLGVNDAFYPMKAENELAGVKKKFDLNKPFLLYTGVWRSHKNLPNLIKAFHVLKKDYSFDGYLVITGRQDPRYAHEIMTPIVSLELKKDIIFTGLVDEKDLVLLYNAASVYVFPSFYEGFGLPPLEAMKCATPVAAANTSSIPEICGPENAVFFDPKNTLDMAEQIHKILSQQTFRENLIQNGLQRVKQFSWEKMAKESLEIYKSIKKT